ncbi:cysteine-rich protein [Cryptosporidium ryanae]|uniref:cysteine-rich protein n=1 Tax=Cryptosporidium ryanae TaxID=515981 RepID=UPI00351A9DC7|nr:cysteine-rich protein [Cryptosporidium ryanae]
MVSSNICPASGINDSSNSLVTSNCKVPECHCEGNGVVTTQSSAPNVTQKCYITNSGCHEAVVTTTTQEVRRHKCPPKVQKIHEHVNTPQNHNCPHQVNNSSCNSIPMGFNACSICTGSRNVCCGKPGVCFRSQSQNYQSICNRSHSYYTCCCCCSTSTVQTTLYPVFMAYPFAQGRNIEVPYTYFSQPQSLTSRYPLTEGAQYQY